MKLAGFFNACQKIKAHLIFSCQDPFSSLKAVDLNSVKSIVIFSHLTSWINFKDTDSS